MKRKVNISSCMTSITALLPHTESYSVYITVTHGTVTGMNTQLGDRTSKCGQTAHCAAGGTEREVTEGERGDRECER